MTHDPASQDHDGRTLALAVTLTALAGFVDAAGFVRFGGVFVSFMSGNSTKMAALPSVGRLLDAEIAAALIVLFVMGAFAGRLLGQAAGRWRRPALLSSTAALLVLAAAAISPGAQGAALSLGGAAMVLAMGLLNSVLHRVGDRRTSLTYVTGTLVSLGHALADAALGAPSEWLSYLLMWLGLVGGAALGALGVVRFGAAALIAPAAAAALIALGLGGQVRREQVRSLP